MNCHSVTKQCWSSKRCYRAEAKYTVRVVSWTKKAYFCITNSCELIYINIILGFLILLKIVVALELAFPGSEAVVKPVLVLAIGLT